MENSKIIFYPDNLMSANEFAYIIKECKFKATVIISSEKIKNKFIGIPNVNFIKLYRNECHNRTSFKANKKRSVKKILLNYVPRLFLIPLRILDFYKKLNYLKLVISNSSSVAIIATDRSYADGFTMPFYCFCKKRNIKMIIPSTATFANKEGMLIARQEAGNDFLATFTEKLFCRKYIEQKDKRELIYYPIDILFAFRFFGVLSDNPWIMGANNAATLCLNNEETACLFQNEGVKKTNISVLGSYKLKNLITNDKDSIEIIGFALPQMYEHNILPWGEHIEIIEQMLFGLSHLNKKVIVFLHPKMERGFYSYLEDKYNCVLSNERTDIGLASTDLYIATYSSTVVTATIYGIPSLVIDCFNARYTMFDNCPSIEVFPEITDLLGKAKKMCLDGNVLKEIKKNVQVDSRRLEESPGNGMENLKKLIESAI